MNHWIDHVAGIQSRGEAAISVAIASTKGSVPREAGTRMLVTASEIFGTIGGGNLEFKATHIARDMLAARTPASTMRFPLGASLGQCCGGLVTLLFEPIPADASWVADLSEHLRGGRCCMMVTPMRGTVYSGKLLVSGNKINGSLGSKEIERDAISIANRYITIEQRTAVIAVAGDEYFFEGIFVPDFNIVLFGAGHVGRALVKVFAEIDCTISWIDSREDAFPIESTAAVAMVINDCPEEEVARARAGSYFLVMTHDHQLDQKICEQILRRNDFAYFGLIGSQSKRRQFVRRLAARGIPARRIDDMICPIGDIGVDSKQPMAIAVSVAAEILLHHAASRHCEGRQYRANELVDAIPGTMRRRLPQS